MPKINLYPEANAQIADLLLGCEDNGMLLYAGTYIKDLERQITEYKLAEEQGNIIRIPITPETVVYSIEYFCGLDESNKLGMCPRGFCNKCPDGKLYIYQATAEASCKIKELGKSVFLKREIAEHVLAQYSTTT